VNKFDHKALKVVFLACLLAVVVIMLGAFTRLVDAGLGCPDWPGCYGQLTWPMTESEIITANKAFPDAPVETDKAWPEMVHRYFAGALGLLAIIIVSLVIRAKKHRPQAPLKHAIFLLAFVILQGLFGMWTVTLKLWPQVVTAHLLGGFITLTTLWLLFLRLRQRPWLALSMYVVQYRQLRFLALLGLVTVTLQIILGGWTTSNYAAVACPDLPTCQGQWLPETNFVTAFNIAQQVGPNYLGGALDNTARVTIHFMHRIGAIVTSIIVLMVIYRLFNIEHHQAKRFGYWILTVLVAQILLGLSNIYFQFPVSVAVLHNIVGAILLVSMAGLCYHLHNVREGVSP